MPVDKKATAADKKKSAKDSAAAKDDSSAAAPAYPPESLTTVGTITVPVQQLLKGVSEVSGVYELKAVGEAGEAVEVEVTVAVSEPLLSDEDASNTNTLTILLHSYHNLPLGFFDNVQPAAAVADSRPPTATAGNKSAGKAKEDKAAAVDDIFTLLYRVPLSGEADTSVWSERASVRLPTEAERASGQPEVTGRWNEPTAKVIEEAAVVSATPATASKDKRAEQPSARGKSPRPETASGGKKAGEKKDGVVEMAAVAAVPVPAVSNAVLSFDFARTTLLTPAAITSFRSSITNHTLFPVQLTCTRLASASTAADPQLSITGLSLLDLSSLLLPGRTRVEGCFAVTQTSAAAVKGGGDDKKGKAKAGVDKGAKGKKDDPNASGGTDLIDTFDACHTYVRLSLELARPLLPTPPPLPLSDLLLASSLSPSPSPLSDLDSLFPPDLSFLYLDASSPARATFRQQVQRVAEQMRAAAGGSAWEDGWRRRLEVTLHRLVRARFTLRLSETRGKEEEERARQQYRNEAYSELMDEVSAVLAESDSSVQIDAESKAQQVEDGVRLWSQLAQQAEEMEDNVLAAYHHASCLQATRAYHRQKRSPASRELQLASLYSHATFLCRRGEWERAELTLHDVLTEEEGHLPSQLLLACILLEQGRLQEAHDLAQPLLRLSLANHPLVQAVLVLLYHHEEEDEKKEEVLAQANSTLRSLPPTVDDTDPLVSQALACAAATQCGWAWLHSGDVCVLGARYGTALGLGRSVAVWLSGVLRAEELREAKEEKELEQPTQPEEEQEEAVDEGPLSPTSASQRLLVKHAALLQYALLLSSQQQDALSLRCANRIAASLNLHSPSSAALSAPVRLYFLSRLASIYYACKRVEECEPLLLAYATLVPRHAHLPLHQPSLSLLTRLLLTKQKRAQALALLAPLIAQQRTTSTTANNQPPAHWLLLTWLDALYADGRWNECVDVAAEVSRVEAVNARWCGMLCCVETRLWKEKEEERDKRQKQEEASHSRAQRRQPSNTSTASFQPSLELQSLATTTTSLEASTLAHFTHFQQLTTQLPLPNSHSALSLLLDLGHRMYDRERWQEAEHCWQAAAAMDEAMAGAGGGVALERLEWIKARKAGTAVEGESEARLIQGLFRRSQRKREGREREHKEVIVVHKSAGNRNSRLPTTAEGNTRRIQSLD